MKAKAFQNKFNSILKMFWTTLSRYIFILTSDFGIQFKTFSDKVEKKNIIKKNHPLKVRVLEFKD